MKKPLIIIGTLLALIVVPLAILMGRAKDVGEPCEDFVQTFIGPADGCQRFEYYNDVVGLFGGTKIKCSGDPWNTCITRTEYEVCREPTHELCSEEGYCTLINESLVVPVEDGNPCLDKDTCIEGELRCGPNDTTGACCGVGSDADCKQSELCTQEGKCTAKEITVDGETKTQCVASSEAD